MLYLQVKVNNHKYAANRHQIRNIFSGHFWNMDNDHRFLVIISISSENVKIYKRNAYFAKIKRLHLLIITKSK